MIEHEETPSYLGRPPKFCDEIADKICLLLCSTNLTIGQVCEQAGITTETFYTWRWTHKQFSDNVARALQQHYQVVGERLLDYAEKDVIEGDKSDNARARVHDTRIKTRQWWLSKLLPQTYGDKLDISHDVTFNVPAIVTSQVSAAPLKPGQAALPAGTPQDVVVEAISEVNIMREK